MNVRETLAWATKRLESEGISEPALSARILLAYVLHISTTKLVFFYTESLGSAQQILFESYIKKRETHMPVAYITEVQNFRGRDFFVNTDVLIPRPETEELVDHALQYQGVEVLLIDLGTGSGVIPISLGLEGAWRHIMAIENSEKALEVAKKNAKEYKVSIDFSYMDATSPEFKQLLDEKIALYKPKKICVTANLPYISLSEKEILDKDVVDFEPHEALFGGIKGSELIIHATQIVHQCASRHHIPYTMIHELDDQMSDEVQKNLDVIVESDSWKKVFDREGKARFLLYDIDNHIDML